MRTERRTDRHDEATSRFSQFSENSSKVVLASNKKYKNVIKYLSKI